ncbi:MAG: hypothetical protein LBH04_06545 [Tannerellaceae bacterium]|jgi:hypothetical protein|nr:hypothetical protein [Tannerellaceae bacterium]
MLLITAVSWKSKDKETAVATVERLLYSRKDQKKLSRIALEAFVWEARLAAVSRLIPEQNQAILAQVAQIDEDWRVRKAAINKLIPDQHQALLARLAERSPSPPPADEAQTEEQRLNLARITGEEREKWACVAAIEKLIPQRHQPLLAKIAKKDAPTDVSRAALSRLIDQSLIAEVAMEATEPTIRRDAIKKLVPAENQQILSEIAETDQNAGVRLSALRRLLPEENQYLLSRLAKDDVDADIRLYSYYKIDNLTVRRKLVIHYGKNLPDNAGLLKNIYENEEDDELLASITSHQGEVYRESHYSETAYESSTIQHVFRV